MRSVLQGSRRVVGVLLAAGFLAAASFPEAPAQPGQAFEPYLNARFGYAIEYPSGLLVPQGESENGDGQQFRTKDGSVVLAVWGRINMDLTGDEQSVAQLFAEACRSPGGDGTSRRVTYKAQKGDFFVLSGFEGRKIFYTKTIVKGDAVATFEILYGESVKAQWDPVTSRISKSFRFARGSQRP